MALDAFATIAAAAVSGGAITKLIERVFARSEKQMDEVSTIRSELREDMARMRQEHKEELALVREEHKEEVTALRSEVRGLSDELVVWRDRYYRVLGENTELRAAYGTLENKYIVLAGRYDILEERFNALREMVPDTDTATA